MVKKSCYRSVVYLHQLLNYLYPISLIYLALPYLIFFAGWLKPTLSIIISSLLIVSIGICIKNNRQPLVKNKSSNPIYVNWIDFSFTLILTVTLIGISGIGGFGFQETYDWRKHNAILSDLINQAWPVIYFFKGQYYPLVYYIAYYLPSAVIGKLCSWSIANIFLFLWSLTGLSLAMAWFSAITRQLKVILFMVFLLFSGLDIFGFLVRELLLPGQFPQPFLIEAAHFEHWAQYWQFSSNTSLLFWVPNQAIASWIVTGMVTSVILHKTKERRYDLILLWSLLLLWSPFAFIGLFPFILSAFLFQKNSFLCRIRHLITLPNVVGIITICLLGFYYIALMQQSSLNTNSMNGIINLTVERNLTPSKLILLILFYIFEIGLYAIVVGIASNKHKWSTENMKENLILYISTITSLLIIPFIHVGSGIDFSARASIPALFILAFLVVDVLNNDKIVWQYKLLLGSILVLGMMTAGMEIFRHTFLNSPAFHTPAMKGLFEILAVDNEFPIFQYIGNVGSGFIRLFFRN